MASDGALHKPVCSARKPQTQRAVFYTVVIVGSQLRLFESDFLALSSMMKTVSVPEIIIASLAAGAYWASFAPLWPSLVLFIILSLLAFYDWRTFRLPNLLTAALFTSGLLFLIFRQNIYVFDHIVGAVVGLAFFPLLNFAYKKLRGRDGVGLGDAKLLAGTGLWLGWQALPFVLLTASLTAILYAALASMRTGKLSAATKLPFGTFLCVGTWVIWLFGTGFWL